MATILQLESSNVDADAEDILQLLPDQFQLEQAGDGKGSVLLVPRDYSRGGTIIVLVAASTKSIESSATLVFSLQIIDSVLRKSSTKVSGIKGDGFDGAIIQLTGGASILLFTTTILSTTRGRKSLAHFADGKNWRKYLKKEGNDGSFVVMPLVKDEIDLAQLKSKLPKFPSLSVSVLQQNNQFQDFPLNSPVGIPVETDLFVGKCTFVLRPNDPKNQDPYYYEQIFSKKKRRLILQVQGKFKREPKGTLYAGGEISKPLKLGLVTKGLSSLILKLLKAFCNDVHYSYGDDVEKAHIVFPALQFFSSIIITKPGGTVPSIAEPFVESNASIKARMNNSVKADWNTTDTYSLAFQTMYLDLPTWRVVQLPVTRDLDLRTFWGDSFLALVMYEGESDRKRRHVAENIQYSLMMKIKYMGLSNTDSDKDASEDDDILPWDKASRLRHSDSFIDRRLERVFSGDSAVTPDSGIFQVESDDEEEDSFLNIPEEDIGLPLEDDDEDDDKTESEYFDTRSTNSINYTSESSVYREYNASLVDNTCPAWINIIRPQKGKYVATYALNIGTADTIYRTASRFAKCKFDKEAALMSIEASCSPRISSKERKRRIIGHALSPMNQSTQVQQKIQNLIETGTKFESTFLQNNPLSLLPSKRRKNAIYTGNIARALSECHWVEEIATLTNHCITFFQPPKYKQPSLRVTRLNVVKVRKLVEKEGPNFPQHYFMAIETIGRTVYLMFASEEACDSWIEELSKQPPQQLLLGDNDNRPLSPTRKGASKGIASDAQLLSVDNPTEEFLHKSSRWSCKQRRILNCRQFSFRDQGSFEITDPSILVADTLRLALNPDLLEVENLQSFLNGVSCLKNVNVSQLPEEERLAFFLNLYHVMIMHAFLVVGFPRTNFQWKSYFSMISYQCSDDIFSLAELDHCIIRGSMNIPTVFASKLVIPKSRYTFALTRADYRINFALNCGSYSNPVSIPIYNANSLEKQLDDATTVYLKQALKVKTKGSSNSLVIYLPRICQWFADDFGSGSSKDVLSALKIQKYLSNQEQKIMSQSTTKGDGISVKYLPFSFECRNLILAETI